MVALGIILVVIGVLFLLLGLAAAARQVFRTATAPSAQAFDPEKWAKLVTALTELTKIAGVWVLITLVGGGLVGAGAYLIGAH